MRIYLKSKIDDVNEEVLHETLTLMQYAIAGMKMEIPGTVTSDGIPVNVDVAVTTPELQSGLGLNYHKGKPEFLGHNCGRRSQLADLRSTFLQLYEVVACEKALKQLGYRVFQPYAVMDSKSIRLQGQRG